MTAPDTPGQARIERAGPEHAEAVAGLHAGLFDPSWPAASLHELLRQPGSIAYLAWAGEPARAAGFILGRTMADEAELLAIGVAPQWQRHGIGRLLMHALCEAARGAEARRLYLEVAAGNVAALQLYGAFGAQEIGRRKAYYTSPGAPPQDAINLAVSLETKARTGGLAGGRRL